MISCEKDENSKLDSIAYKSTFSTETRPISIAVEKTNGFIYIANDNSSGSNYSSKIQKFNSNGELQATIFNFETFTGLFKKYCPIDLCIDNNDIFVLVKPLSQSNDTWIPYSGFCILHCDLDGILINEFDFSQIENSWNFSAIAFSNDYLYVTSGEIVIFKIAKNSGQLDYIHIPITNDKHYLLVSDMVIESEDNIFITGQGPWQIELGPNNDVSICHITRFDCIADKSYTFYSNSRTGIMAAMPNNPGMTIKDSKYIYLATFYGRSLEIYDKEKDNELIFHEDLKPNDIDDILPIDVGLYKNNIYVVDYKNNNVHVYSEAR